ncbi:MULTISPECIES: fasciclin domain-containing protein [unclassified Chitinophaga]|uniref:fasciclin domain-containing protein n=1 Tax=unclassified Chitinophaga TaxID=2619133 RepID=UPI0030103857
MNCLRFRKTTGWIVAIAWLPGLLLSCVKNLDTSLEASLPLKTAPFANVGDALKAGKASLFFQAVTRSGLDSDLYSAVVNYTVLAPSDSAMLAAGFTKEVINTLSVDSLKKLIGYHIITGALSAEDMGSAVLPIKAPTLVNVPPYPGQYGNWTNMPGQPLPVFVKYYAGHGLYVNDERVGDTTSLIRAANGYIFTSRKVIIPPFGHTIMDFIRSQPDLSLYYNALKIVDSINRSLYNIEYGEYEDTLIFQKQGIYNYNNLNTWTPGNCLTVFAPTNAAFEAAGLHTVSDILDYAFVDGSTSFTYQSPMDSVLRRHVVFDYLNTNPAKAILLYADLAYNSMMVNNTGMNVYVKSSFKGYDGGNFMKLPSLVFSAVNNIPYIQWSVDPGKPRTPVPAEDPSAQYPHHFFGRNGVVYKVNTLFIRN